MKGNRFYSIPYDARNDPTMRRLRMRLGGIVAFGRWQALLGLLYDEDGTIDLTDETMHRVIEAELELNGEKLDDFIQELVAVGWLDGVAWESFGKVHSRSVAEQIEYQRTQADKRKGKTKEAQFVKELVDAGLLDEGSWQEYAKKRPIR